MLLNGRKLSVTLLYCDGASLRADELVALDAGACRHITPLFAGPCHNVVPCDVVAVKTLKVCYSAYANQVRCQGVKG